MNFDPQAFNPQAQAEQDRRLLVRFFIKPVKDRRASEKAGRPIFRDTEYIDIKIPGNRTGGACRPASDRDKKRFPDHYRAFKERGGKEEQGTPLIEWPAVTRSQVEELNFYHVRTVEQLAEVNDNAIQGMMGIGDLKNKARAYLELAGKQAEANKLTDALKERDKKIDELQKQVLELAKKLEEEWEEVTEPQPAPPSTGRRRAKVQDGK